MEFEKIKELPIKEIMARNCVLALWVPVPLLPLAFELFTEWGFIYKTEYVWHKTNPETGAHPNTASHYNKLEHENLLIATHGKMTPEMDEAMQFPSVFEAPRGAEHS